jgi:hypothetical protein
MLFLFHEGLPFSLLLQERFLFFLRVLVAERRDGIHILEKLYGNTLPRV